MNKKLVVAVGMMVLSLGVFAAPPRGGHGGGHAAPPPQRHVAPPRHHSAPPPPAHHYHHSPSVWGKGGRNFLPGFVGGLVGGAIVSRPMVVPPPPVVVPAPVVVAPIVQQVWVEGCYVDQVQANGMVVRVWQPGHYEQRVIR